MKQIIVIFACALLSPLAFAQSSPTEEENPATGPAPFAQSSPTEEENPTTGPAPFAQSSPTEEENPTTGLAPFAQSSPTEEENPTTGLAPFAQSSPTEDENPTTEPAAFAPSSPTEEENSVTEPSPANAEGTVNGTVLAFTEDEMLVLKTTADDPINFMLSKTAYVDGAGNEITTPMIQEGTKVQVTYSLNGDQMIVSRVVIEE